jgi:hypothetical protein
MAPAGRETVDSPAARRRKEIGMATQHLPVATLVLACLFGCAGVGEPPARSAAIQPGSAAQPAPTPPQAAPPGKLAAAPALGQPAANLAPGTPAAKVPSGPHPVLVIDKPSLELGEVKEGTEGVATFQLKNTGDADLKILSARPG